MSRVADGEFFNIVIEKEKKKKKGKGNNDLFLVSPGGPDKTDCTLLGAVALPHCALWAPMSLTEGGDWAGNISLS